MTAPRYFAVQLAKGATAVPLKVWFGHPIDPDTGETLTERPAIWRTCLDGDDINAYTCPNVFWTDKPGPAAIKGKEIDADEYEFLLRRNAHARTYVPTAPEANPRKTIKLTELPPIRWTP